MTDRSTLFRRLLLAALLVSIAAANGCRSTADRCAELAAEARRDAVAAFDAEDPAELSYANVVNRPQRRAALGRAAFERTFDACMGEDPRPAQP
jgi:hypothetical protein